MTSVDGGVSLARAGARAPASLPQLQGEPRLRAVLFDAGLTLIRTATAAHDVAAEALASHGLRPHIRELREAMGLAEQRIEETWLREEWWGSEVKVRELFVGAYRAGLPVIPAIGDNEDLAAEMAHAIYEEYHETRHWELYPDVLPTLRRLGSTAARMGIVSDWGHGLEAIVLELELGQYLEFLVVSSRLGLSKPNPEVFRMALDRIGVPPECAVYVGDSYVKDVLGARAAGLAPVLLDRAGAAPILDCPVVDCLTALLPLVGVENPDLGDTAR